MQIYMNLTYGSDEMHSRQRLMRSCDLVVKPKIAFIGIHTSFDQKNMEFLSCCFCILSKLVLSGNTDVFKK